MTCGQAKILGPSGAKVLAVAAALESLLAGDPWAPRLTPDIARSKAAPKLKDSPNVLGFDRIEIAPGSGFRAQARGKPWNDVVFSSKANHKRGETI
jgi:hypothetical protein